MNIHYLRPYPIVKPFMIYMWGSRNGGTPIARWFISWKLPLKWMMTGGTPILGNPHIRIGFARLRGVKFSHTLYVMWRKSLFKRALWIMLCEKKPGLIWPVDMADATKRSGVKGSQLRGALVEARILEWKKRHIGLAVAAVFFWSCLSLCFLQLLAYNMTQHNFREWACFSSFFLENESTRSVCFYVHLRKSLYLSPHVFL